MKNLQRTSMPSSVAFGQDYVALEQRESTLQNNYFFRVNRGISKKNMVN